MSPPIDATIMLVGQARALERIDAPLHSLTNLTYLNVGGTRVTDTEVDKLRKALPNCEIDR